MAKKELIIMPNEKELEEAEIYTKIFPNKNDRHGMGIKEFSDKYNLGLTPEIVGVEEGNYNGHKWGIALAKIGHISIHIEDFLVFYTPTTITINQYQYIMEMRKYILRYQNYVAATFIDNKNNCVNNLRDLYPEEYEDKEKSKLFLKAIKSINKI